MMINSRPLPAGGMATLPAQPGTTARSQLDARMARSQPGTAVNQFLSGAVSTQPQPHNVAMPRQAGSVLMFSQVDMAAAPVRFDMATMATMPSRTDSVTLASQSNKKFAIDPFDLVNATWRLCLTSTPSQAMLPFQRYEMQSKGYCLSFKHLAGKQQSQLSSYMDASRTTLQIAADPARYRQTALEDTSSQADQLTTPSIPGNRGVSFLDFPGELRNKVYRYAMNSYQLHQMAYDQRRSQTQEGRQVLNKGFNVLRLNKQIHQEAFSLFCSECPIHMTLNVWQNIAGPWALLRQNRHAQLSPLTCTLLNGLEHCLQTHIDISIAIDQIFGSIYFNRVAKKLSEVADMMDTVPIPPGRRRNVTVVIHAWHQSFPDKSEIDEHFREFVDRLNKLGYKSHMHTDWSVVLKGAADSNDLSTMRSSIESFTRDSEKKRFYNYVNVVVESTRR